MSLRIVESRWSASAAGVAGAVKAAGLPYGRALEDGITFHALRHTAATILAELDVSVAKRKSVMGHRHVGPTQKYTHMRPMHEIAPVEQLSAALPISDLVTVRWRRAARATLPEPVQQSVGPAAETRENTGVPATRKSGRVRE